MTYWDMNNIEVDNIMTELVKKSLASSEYDQSLDCDVYSIHVLLLDYLKTQLKEEEEKSLHKKLLHQYFSKVNFQYGKLEDDSYIFSNLGYQYSSIFCKLGINHFQFRISKTLAASFIESNFQAAPPVLSLVQSKLQIVSVPLLVPLSNPPTT